MNLIRLDLEDFKKLVAGKEIVCDSPGPEDNVKIILADIGFRQMIKAVHDEIDEMTRYIQD